MKPIPSCFLFCCGTNEDGIGKNVPLGFLSVRKNGSLCFTNQGDKSCEFRIRDRESFGQGIAFESLELSQYISVKDMEVRCSAKDAYTNEYCMLAFTEGLKKTKIMLKNNSKHLYYFANKFSFSSTNYCEWIIFSKDSLPIQKYQQSNYLKTIQENKDLTAIELEKTLSSKPTSSQLPTQKTTSTTPAIKTTLTNGGLNTNNNANTNNNTSTSTSTNVGMKTNSTSPPTPDISTGNKANSFSSNLKTNTITFQNTKENTKPNNATLNKANTTLALTTNNNTVSKNSSSSSQIVKTNEIAKTNIKSNPITIQNTNENMKLNNASLNKASTTLALTTNSSTVTKDNASLNKNTDEISETITDNSSKMNSDSENNTNDPISDSIPDSGIDIDSIASVTSPMSPMTAEQYRSRFEGKNRLSYRSFARSPQSDIGMENAGHRRSSIQFIQNSNSLSNHMKSSSLSCSTDFTNESQIQPTSDQKKRPLTTLLTSEHSQSRFSTNYTKKKNKDNNLVFERVDSPLSVSSNGSKNIYQEMLQTEEVYCNDLEILLDSYLLPLYTFNPPILRNQLLFIEWISSLSETAHEFLNELRKIDIEDSEEIGKLFIRFKASLSAAYENYCLKQNEILLAIEDLVKSNLQIAEHFENTKSIAKKLGVDGYIIKPLQRLCRYKLLLSSMIKEGEEQPNLHEAINFTQCIAEEIDTKIRNRELLQNLFQECDISLIPESLTTIVVLKDVKFKCQIIKDSKKQKPKQKQKQEWKLVHGVITSKRLLLAIPKKKKKKMSTLELETAFISETLEKQFSIAFMKEKLKLIVESDENEQEWIDIFQKACDSVKAKQIE